MAQPYGEWTVQKLKVELVRRGPVVSGRNKDLVERYVVVSRLYNLCLGPSQIGRLVV